MFQAQDVTPFITEALGTEVETRYTPGKKLSALSYARDEVIKIIKPESAYAPVATLNFNNKVAKLPANYLVWVKMLHITDSRTEYYKTSINGFDTAPAGYWKIDKDGTDPDENNNPKKKIYINIDIPQARFRFIDVSAPIADQLEWIDLSRLFMRPMGYLAASKILGDDQRFGEAFDRQKMGVNLLTSANAAYLNETKHTAKARMSSVFDFEESLFDPDQW